MDEVEIALRGEAARRRLAGESPRGDCQGSGPDAAVGGEVGGAV